MIDKLFNCQSALPACRTTANNGKVYTYGQVKDKANEFKNSLDSDDVVVCWMYMHGFNLPWPYLNWVGLFGDWYRSGGIITDELLKPMGNPLDFLWLYSCYSWDWREDFWGSNFNELKKPENAGKFIFWGHKGKAETGDQSEAFNNKLVELWNNGAWGCVGSQILTHINQVCGDNWKQKRHYPGCMDLFDIDLKCADDLGSMMTSFDLDRDLFSEPNLLNQEGDTNFSLDNVNCSLYDRDGDGNNDSMIIFWDANTVFPEANVVIAGYVTDTNHTMIQPYEYGPYTIYGNTSEKSSFNFTANNINLYCVELFLANKTTGTVIGASIQNISLDKAIGITIGYERFTDTWFDTRDSDNDGIEDTVNVSWNVDTTISQENISVLILVGEELVKCGPYTIFNSSLNTGYVEIYINHTGTYRTSLMLVDSESYCEDFSYLEIPLGVSRFTDNYADYGIDDDGDGLYEYLAFDIGVNISALGNYTISASLYDTDVGLDIGGRVRNLTYLEPGIQTVQLLFEGEKLYKSGYDGEYSLRFLILENERYNGSIGERKVAYTTSLYNHTQFQHPVIMFDSFSDYGIDTNSNSLYEYLRINATVNNTVAGNYTITGYLYNENKSFAVATANNPYLNTGLQTIQLDFNGTLISYQGANGPYSLTINAYSNITQVNSRENAYLTNIYNSSEFETSFVSLYEYLDLDIPTEILLGQTYNITAKITNPSGRVLENLQTSISLPSELNTTDPLIINLGDFQPFETKEASWIIEAIAPGYGSIIFNITSLDIQNVSITRDIIVHHFLLSVDTDKDFYKKEDAIIISTNTTNGNPEVSYLNLSMNVTIQGENLSENYSQPVFYIGSLDTKNITFTWDTSGKASGIYIVTARIFEGLILLNETLTSFEIDGIVPELIDNTPSEASVGCPFTFNATVTDNIEVSSVWVEYWYDDGSHTNVSMTYVADSYWEKTIIIDDTLDTMHYIIAANDTSNNWNNTGIKDVTIYDNDDPEITNVQAIPSIQNIGSYVNISAVVTDNIEVYEVYLYIEYPDSSVENLSITQNKTGDTYYCNKTYQQPGVYTYHIWANDTSGNVNISADYTFEIVNSPPDAPDISGPLSGTVGVEYEYTFVSTDPGGDDIDSYTIDWGDNNIEVVDGPFVSGEEITRSHTWDNQGTYTIKAKAIDIYGAESEWGTLEVTMPRDKAIIRPLLQFLQSHPNKFPILQKILLRLGL